MDDIDEIPFFPRRKYSWKEKLRRCYARHFYDILDTIFLLNIGLILLMLLCVLGGILK